MGNGVIDRFVYFSIFIYNHFVRPQVKELVIFDLLLHSLFPKALRMGTELIMTFMHFVILQM